MNPRSLGFQLVAWYAGLLTGVFVVSGALRYLDLRRSLEQQWADLQFHRARRIAEALVARVAQTGERYVTDEINARYAPEINNRFLRVTRGDGSVMYVSGTPEDRGFDPAHLGVLKVPLAREFIRKERAPGEDELLIAAVPYGRGTNQFVVEAGVSTRLIHAVLTELLGTVVWALPVVVAIAVGGGYLLVRRALTPVDRIARSAEQITLQNLSRRLPVARTGDELERLSLSLNHMITRLDESFQQTRRFVADASHELRTPLTIMRGELENMVQEPRLPADLRESIGSTLEEVERLAKIVENLLALSRLDAGDAQTQWVKFDLAELASTTTEQIWLLAEDKGISVTCHAERPVMVEGDRARLKQVVVNLLDNAIKYTPRGGAVTLTVGTVNGNAVLEVVDNGIGIPAEALPHVFERFFRVDKARAREMGGAGIGLSIVKAICTAHRGRVDVQSTERQGSRFKVVLPLANRGS